MNIQVMVCSIEAQLLKLYVWDWDPPSLPGAKDDLLGRYLNCLSYIYLNNFHFVWKFFDFDNEQILRFSIFFFFHNFNFRIMSCVCYVQSNEIADLLLYE